MMGRIIVGMIVLFASVTHAAPCEVGDTEGCTTKCSAHDQDSCGILGTMYADGRGVAKDVDKAVAMLTAACDAKSVRACIGLAIQIEIGGGIAKDEARAHGDYEKFCDHDKNLYACVRLASTYLFGHGVTADPARALKLLTQACDGGEPAGCFNLGFVSENGMGTAKDPQTALGFYRKACDARSANACGQLAWMYDEARGIPKDQAKARKIYKKACEYHLWTACTRFGYMLVAGLGGDKDAEQALPLVQSACDHAEIEGCNTLAAMYTAGDGVARDEAKGLQMYKSACDAGNVNACANRGWLLRLQSGGGRASKSAAIGMSLLEKACADKNAWACDKVEFIKQPDARCDKLGGTEAGACLNDAGLALDTGSGGANANPKKAATLFEKACELEVPAGCSNLGAELYSGKYLARDVPRGLTLLRKACSADKIDGACKYLKGLPAWAQNAKKLPAWAKDGPIEPEESKEATGPGCASFWDSLDKQSSSIKIASTAKPVDRALTRLHGSKRPDTINEQIWKGCSALWEQHLKSNRDKINRETAEAERQQAIDDERAAERESERAADRARSDETFRQMRCKSDCYKMCRARAPGDECMSAQQKCSRGCEGR